MYLLYSILLVLSTILSAPLFLTLSFMMKKYRHGLTERLGFLPLKKGWARGGEKLLWLHAVSVGEITAALPLLKEIRRRRAELKLVVSVVTPGGYQVAQEKFPEADLIFYFPLDYPWVVKRVIDQLSPSLFVMIETEIWPNFLRYLAQKNIPSILVNGRISPKSFQRYTLVKPFMTQVLSSVTLFSMRGEEDATRLLKLGADPKKVLITGNIKFDQPLNPLTEEEIEAFRAALNLDQKSSVMIAGSTHKGEEEIILDVYSVLKAKYPYLALVIAPRHIERVGEIEALLKKKRLAYVKKSELMNQREPIIVLDTFGELMKLYGIGTIIFVGKSLVPEGGGHNILEPAAYGKPVLFGPYMSNFSEIAELLKASGGGIEVHSQEELLSKIEELLEDRAKWKLLGVKAAQVVKNHQGALSRTLAILEVMSDE